MWGYLKILIFVLLLVFLLVAFGYIFLNRYMVSCIDAKLEGENRETPDIVIDPGPSSGTATRTSQKVHPLVLRHMKKKAQGQLPYQALAKQEEKAPEKGDEEEEQEDSSDSELDMGFIPE